jgi:site-specific recombinase
LSGRLGGPRIDALLAAADHRQAFEARLVWLADVVHWVSTAGGAAPARDPTRPAQLTRLLHLLNLLDRNPEWKRRFALSVRSLVRELDALDVYCESGLPREAALLSEAAERLLVRLLPRNPYRTDLGSVLAALFPRAEDALWLEQIDAATLERVGRVVADGETPEERGWNVLWDDVPEALLLLIGELRVLGLSAPIRRRLGSASFRESPFFGLTGAAEAALAALASRDEAAAAAVERLRELLRRCVLTTDEVHAHLDEFGVSVKVVYLLERIRSLVRRIEDLLELLVRPEPAADGSVRFLARLVRDSRARTELRGLVSQNLGLLAKKVVDRAAETGEHYIARTREEYREILRAAAGGGLLMAGTTYVKLGIVGLHASPFVSGLLASLNYALSFVAIQLAHFTLATKQPAMTAPALAAKMDQVDTPEGLERLVDEVVHLLRSQMASIIGNLLLVPPAAILLAGIALLAGAGPPMDPEKARHTLESMSILGPSALYAAFTGVLLWLSSLASGWADNWFALRRIHEGLAHDRRLRGLIGRRRSEAVAAYAQHHVSGIAGNVSLGFLLGMIPALGAFVGLPLDIRHVTLGAGYLAAAAFSLGLAALREPALWLALLGLGGVGLFNVGVSFGLALRLALQAREVRAPEREAVRRALWRRLRERPLSFVYPSEIVEGA